MSSSYNVRGLFKRKFESIDQWVNGVSDQSFLLSVIIAQKDFGSLEKYLKPWKFLSILHHSTTLLLKEEFELALYFSRTAKSFSFWVLFFFMMTRHINESLDWFRAFILDSFDTLSQDRLFGGLHRVSVVKKRLTKGIRKWPWVV